MEFISQPHHKLTLCPYPSPIHIYALLHRRPYPQLLCSSLHITFLIRGHWSCDLTYTNYAFHDTTALVAFSWSRNRGSRTVWIAHLVNRVSPGLHIPCIAYRIHVAFQHLSDCEPKSDQILYLRDSSWPYLTSMSFPANPLSNPTKLGSILPF